MVQKTPSLKGRTIAITRPAGQAEEAGSLIKQMGGVPYYIPAIEIKPLSSPAPVEQFIAELQQGKVDYVVFMSTNGAKYLFSAADDLGQTGGLKEGLAKAFVVAVGPRTAEALQQEYGVHVSLVPQKYSSEGILESLQGVELKGKTVRIPRTSNATPALADGLKAHGAVVEEIYVYESGLPVDEELKERFYRDLTGGCIEAVVFGSGLSAKNIFRMLAEKAPMEQVRAVMRCVATVAIGPTTAEALRELGVKVDVTPQNYLFQDALAALAQFWNTKQTA